MRDERESRSSSASAAGGGAGERGGEERAALAGAAWKGPVAAQRGGVEAPDAAGNGPAGGEVAGVERLQWVAHHDAGAGRRAIGAARRRVDHVEQLADRHRRRAPDVGALVVAGVGDDQLVGRGEHGVEQQLAVLAAAVTLSDAGSASVRSSSSRTAPRGKTPSARPSRYTTRWGTERIGTSVQIVRCPVRKLARVGRPLRRSASSARIWPVTSSLGLAVPATLALADGFSSKDALVLSRALFCVARRGGGERRPFCGGGERACPGVDRHRRRRTASTGSATRATSLGQLPGEVDRAGRRRRRAGGRRRTGAARPRSSRRRAARGRAPASQVPFGTSASRWGRCAFGVQASQRDAGAARDPLAQAGEVVVVDREAAARIARPPLGEVEHLRGGHALVGQLQQQGSQDAEHRVGLAQRAAGQPHRAAGACAVPRRHPGRRRRRR